MILSTHRSVDMPVLLLELKALNEVKQASKKLKSEHN